MLETIGISSEMNFTQTRSRFRVPYALLHCDGWRRTWPYAAAQIIRLARNSLVAAALAGSTGTQHRVPSRFPFPLNYERMRPCD